MGIQEFPQVEANATLAQVREIVAETNQILDFTINGKLDSRNIREIAGYLVGLTEFMHKSGLVGLSGADPLNPDAIRFWAGLADKTNAPYRVNQAGELTAMAAYIMGTIEALSGHIGGFTIEADKLSSDSGYGIIEGGTVRTGAPGTARVEMKDNSVQTFNEDDHLQGPVWGETNPSASFGDFSLYDDGVEVIRFENQLAGNGYLIKSVGAFSSLRLGGVGRNTQATGTWRFYGGTTFDLDISGKISEAYYADNAGSAAAADSLAPSGNVAWGQVLKSGSNLADLATKNLSSLTEDSTHRTVTDTEKSTWNSKRDGNASNNTYVSAYPSATQSFSSGTYQKVVYNSEESDFLSEWDTTQSRFQPSSNKTVIIQAGVHLSSVTSGSEIAIAVYKNGSVYRVMLDQKPGSSGFLGTYGTASMYLTTSDYIEIFLYVSSAYTSVADKVYTYVSIVRSS